MREEVLERGGLPTGRFVYIGELTDPKGVGTLLAADALFRGEVVIDLWGPRPSRGMLRSIELARRLEYRGELLHEDVQRTLSRYDALVVPTTYGGEGYPGVVVEAFGAGVPVVASNFMSIPELVTSDVGRLFTPGDGSELATILNDLATNPAELLRLREGVNRERLRFESSKWDSMVSSLLVELGRHR